MIKEGYIETAINLPTPVTPPRFVPEAFERGRTRMIMSGNQKNSSVGSPQRLRRVWEIAINLKCPVVGTCLNDKEITKIFKKAKCAGHNKMSAYMLHNRIMERLYNENRISQLTDRHLRTKYRLSISEFAHLEETAFMELWDERLTRGDFDSLFYIAAVRPDLSPESSLKIFGEVHMLGHVTTKEVMRTRMKIAPLEKANKDLREKLVKVRGGFRDLKNELSVAASELNEAHARITKLSRERARFRRQLESAEPDGEKKALSEKLGAMEIENRKSIKEIRRMEKEKRKLQIELFELRSTNQILAQEIKELISGFAGIGSCQGRPCNRDSQDCQNCPRRILIVGGITRMKHMYRDLVESGGGEFDYHDGYMKTGKQKIDAKVRGADMVICPVNCNSHGACEQVKRLCKKYGKPVKLLPTSSLSAVSAVLFNEN